MKISKARAKWLGGLEGGRGMYEIPGTNTTAIYTASSRFEDEEGSNPEELIAAAHSGCYSMALSHGLEDAGYQPQQVETEAKVELTRSEDGFAITKIHLSTQAQVPDISEDAFLELANKAKVSCPVSQLLDTEISLEAQLVES